MRRPLSIALASLFVAALAVPTAQGATRRYDFRDQRLKFPGKVGILSSSSTRTSSVMGPTRRASPRMTPSFRFAATRPMTAPRLTAQSNSGNNYIKLRKGSFSYSYSSAVPTSDPPGNMSATLTGKVLEKKKGKQLRVNGSV